MNKSMRTMAAKTLKNQSAKINLNFNRYYKKATFKN